MSNVNVTDRLAQGLDRAQQVLLLCAGRPEGCTFTDCSRTTALPAPTLSRLLRSLEHLDWIVHEADRYLITDRARTWARGLLGATRPVDILRPLVQELAAETGESAAFYEIVDEQVVLQAKCEMPDGTHYMHEGGTVPEICRHGFAQLWVAQMGETERLRRLRDDPAPPDDAEAFLAACEDIRRTGVVVERGMHSPAVMRIAAALRRGAEGPFIGSIGISLPHAAMADREAALRAAVQRAATAASGRLNSHSTCIPVQETTA